MISRNMYRSTTIRQFECDVCQTKSVPTNEKPAPATAPEAVRFWATMADGTFLCPPCKVVLFDVKATFAKQLAEALISRAATPEIAEGLNEEWASNLLQLWEAYGPTR